MHPTVLFFRSFKDSESFKGFIVRSSFEAVANQLVLMAIYEGPYKKKLSACYTIISVRLAKTTTFVGNHTIISILDLRNYYTYFVMICIGIKETTHHP